MKICPNCHAQLDDSSIFCTSCGTQFGAVPPQQNEVPPQQSAVPPQQNAIPPQQNAVPPQPAFAPAYDPYDHILGWIAFPILQGIIWVIKIISFFQICSGKAKEPAIIRSFGFLR